MTAVKAFQQEAATEDFATITKMISKVTKKFQRQNGGDWDELQSVAHEAFLIARQKYNPRKTGFEGKTVKFSSYVQTKVFWALVNHQQEKIRKALFPLSNVDPKALGCDDETSPEGAIPQKPHFKLGEFLEEVSDDAATVAVAGLTMFSDNRPCRQKLFTQMMNDFGWAAKRFWAAVKELREALSS